MLNCIIRFAPRYKKVDELDDKKYSTQSLSIGRTAFYDVRILEGA